jgi:hypothetical protein
MIPLASALHDSCCIQPSHLAGGGTVDQDLLKHVVLEAVKDVAESMILTKLHAVQEAVEENKDATEALGAQLGVLSRLELEDFRSDGTPSVLRNEFKRHLIAHYEPEDNSPFTLKCMATGLYINSGDIQVRLWHHAPYYSTCILMPNMLCTPMIHAVLLLTLQTEYISNRSSYNLQAGRYCTAPCLVMTSRTSLSPKNHWFGDRSLPQCSQGHRTWLT